MPANATYRAPSVGRALNILSLVAANPGGLGISELARRLELSKGTVFGLCQQLETGNALIRDAQTKRYLLGPLIATLAGRGLVHARLREAAGPELTRLRDELKESVFLGVLGRSQIAVVDTRQPAGVIRVAAAPGTRLPLTAGAVGKVFLAGLPAARISEILAEGLPAHTPRTVTDPQVYRAQLEQVRRQGWCTEQDEYLLGLWGAAAPVGAEAGLPAAIWAIGFTSALHPGRLDELAQALVAAARNISQALHAA